MNTIQMEGSPLLRKEGSLPVSSFWSGERRVRGMPPGIMLRAGCHVGDQLFLMLWGRRKRTTVGSS